MSWILFLLSFAHAKKQKTPCWVSLQCEPYPSQEYLIGVGSGDSIEQADNSAIGAISKQFVVNIEQTQISQKELSETSRQNKEISALEHQSLRTKTAVNTNMHLTGVQIAERFHYQKKKESRHYSLAIISKEAWLKRIAEERSELRDEINRLLFEIKKTEHVLNRIQYYQEIIPLIEHEKGLLQQEKIIDPDGAHFPLTATKSNILGQQAREQKEIYFVVEAAESSALVEQALNELGFSVKPSISEVSSAISVHLKEDISISQPDTFGFITAKSNLVLQFSIPSQELLRIKLISSSSSRSTDKAEQNLDSAIVSDVKNLQPKIEALLQGLGRGDQ